MSRGRRSRRRRSGGGLETGLGLAALGMFLLLLPVFMNSPLQQSALEPLEPVGWIMLLVGIAVSAWCLRPVSKAASESLGWLSMSSSRQPSTTRAEKKRTRSRRSRRSYQEPPDDAKRRAELKAAIKANVARMPLTDPETSDESAFPDTVLAMPASVPRSRPPGESRFLASVPPDVRLRSGAPSSLFGDGSEGDDGEDDLPDTPQSTPPDTRPPTDVEPLREAPPTHWTPRVFQLIEWRRFEAVVEALFLQAGLRTRARKHPRKVGVDEGIDIFLYSRHATRTPVTVVKCRHGQGRPVSVTEVRRFCEAMSSHEVSRGTYATTSTFTADAQTFASEHGIHAMDSDALLALIASRTPEQQEELLRTAFEGEYWRPTCSHCGIKLVRMGSARNGSLYWGCPNTPTCRVRMPIAA